ncbi:hypothetical protein ACPESN_02325 [Stutzerimonas marianensis]|uniref:hypothetical protein n=1 Tax=Stutzerimonas marianensis TaxID=2929513 RepID=UPI003C2CFB3C
MIKLSPRAQLAVGVALVALMAVTRGQHLASVNLPSASWAVFFVAGILLAPRWVFPMLFVEASLLDLASVGWQTASSYCLSPSYWLLLPAYGALWLGGRTYARLHQAHWHSLATLMACMALSAFVGYLFSGGGYLFFSGQYADPTLAQLAERILHYYPRNLANMALYVGVATALYVGLLGVSAQRAEARA